MTIPVDIIISKVAKKFAGLCKLYLIAQSNSLTL